MWNNRAGRLLDFASRNSLRLFMAALLFAALFYSLYDLCFLPAYPVGDWLINYSAGFVRRGLIGECILLIAHVIHIPAPWILVVLQLAFYTAFLAGVYRLAAPLRRDPLWYAMVFSPAALAFMILAPFNSIRKDMLAPAALIAVIFILRRKPPALVLSLIITVFFAVMMLSHEAPYCCLPYFFAAVAIATRNLKYAAKVMAVPVIVTAVLLNVARLHPGNESVAIAICHSVGGHWFADSDFRNLCSGGIEQLRQTMSRLQSEQRAQVQFLRLYIVLIILSLAPYIAALIVLYRRDRLRFDVKVISWTAALCALASSPLFLFGIDWGRWIQMQILCLLLVILMAARRAPGFQPDSTAPPLGAGRPWRKPLLVAVFLYCTCWLLPELGLQGFGFGYFAVPRYLYHELRINHQIHAWQTIDRGW